jgi:hypothetical protein
LEPPVSAALILGLRLFKRGPNPKDACRKAGLEDITHVFKDRRGSPTRAEDAAGKRLQCNFIRREYEGERKRRKKTDYFVY